ncbi:hypothetical protein N9L06_02230 [Mariniblastus sp.]|nr:hypothetical protein [Mariniblastus sp.]
MWVEDEDTGEKRLARPSDAQWPQTVAILEQYKELLDAFRKTSNLKSLGLELQPDARDYSDEDFAALFPCQEKANHKSFFADYNHDGLLDGASIAILLPHVQAMRRAARLLHIDSRLAVVEGDSDRAVQNIETVLGLANQTADTPTLVNTLVAVAITRIGFDQLEEIISESPDFFSETQLAKLQDRIQKTDIRSWLNYKGEQLLLKDMVQRCYTDDGNGDGRMTAAGMQLLNGELFGMVALVSDNVSSTKAPLSSFEQMRKAWATFTDSEFGKSAIAPTSLFTCASRKEVMAKAEELYEELEADRKLPFWKSRSSKPDGWKDFDDFLEQNKTEYILLATVMPPVQPVRATVGRTVARKNAVLTALAMYRYHLQDKRWPKTKDDLVPKFLNKMPVDILTGKPLHFKIVDDRPLVYSVGMDHDDDGGVDGVENGEPLKRMQIQPGPKSNDFEGDWILWPQTDSPES